MMTTTTTTTMMMTRDGADDRRDESAWSATQIAVAHHTRCSGQGAGKPDPFRVGSQRANFLLRSSISATSTSSATADGNDVVYPFASVQVDASHLAGLPHLKPYTDGRVINFSSLWDGQTWQQWIPYEKGLIPLQIVDVSDGGYFAKNAAREDDLYLEFSDFMWKRASWNDLAHWLLSVEESIFRIATSLSKVDHFNVFLAERSESDRVDYTRFISTEIEYLFWRCRSLFDDLQQIVACLWSKVRLLDPETQRKKRELPRKSFREALQKIQKWDTAKGPAFGLPGSLLDAYQKVGEFFFKLRGIRDRLTHGGGRLEPIFMVPEGNAIRHDGPLAAMPPKELHVEISKNLVSLRPVISHLVFGTLQAFNEFAVAFTQVIQFPPSMFPEHRYFLRCAHMKALAAAQRDLQPQAGSTSHIEHIPNQ